MNSVQCRINHEFYSGLDKGKGKGVDLLSFKLQSQRFTTILQVLADQLFIIRQLFKDTY